MEAFLLVILFSAALGSFANNVVSAFVKDTTLDIYRSKCFCGKRNLNWFENIPLFSFAILKGRCNECGEKISLRFFVTEITITILGLITYEVYGVSFLAGVNFLIFYTMLIIGFVDYKKYIIPNILLVFLLTLIIGKHLYMGIVGGLTYNLIISIFITAILSGVNLWYKKKKNILAIGFGDVKFIAVLVLIMNPLLAMLAVWFSAVLAIIFFIISNKIGKNKIPYGLSLSLAFIFIELNHNAIMDLLNSYIGV